MELLLSSATIVTYSLNCSAAPVGSAVRFVGCAVALPAFIAPRFWAFAIMLLRLVAATLAASAALLLLTADCCPLTIWFSTVATSFDSPWRT